MDIAYCQTARHHLWSDTTPTVVPKRPELFDLVLVHDKPDRGASAVWTMT
jgi:hypothetical protein